MSIQYKSNIDKIVKALDRMDSTTTRVVERGMKHGLRKFESHIISSQMSGRPGLRRQTGNLANSWRVETDAQSSDVIGKLRTRAKYAVYHEEDIRPRIAPKIPKRLHLYRDFKRTGLKMLRARVLRELVHAAKRGEL